MQTKETRKRKLRDVLESSQLPEIAPEALETLVFLEDSYQQQTRAYKDIRGYDYKGVRINCGLCGTSIADLHRACINTACQDPETFCMGCSSNDCPKCGRQHLEVHDCSKSLETGQMHDYVERAQHFCSVHHATASRAAEEAATSIKGILPNIN